MTLLATEKEKVDLGVVVNPVCNFLQTHQLMDSGKGLMVLINLPLPKCLHFNAIVLEGFTKRADGLLEKQGELNILPVHKYEKQVYGQDIYHQQGLILNFNILRTFCNNVMRIFKVGPRDSGLLLDKLTREAFDPEALCIQAVEWYNCKEFPYKGVPVILTRISIWPLHEPVLSSYDDRKEALSKRYKAHKDPKSDVLAIYTPSAGEATWCNQKGEPLPTKFHKSRHFKRVMDIVRTKSKYGLYPTETDPAKESNWVYYIAMFDPTVSKEAAHQGYIGETSQSLVDRMKQHARGKAMIIHYNLALISQYAHQRGENLSEYVAVFALGTTPDSKLREDVEGKLIRESMEDGFSVTNMKYGMNNKQGANNPNEGKDLARKYREDDMSGGHREDDMSGGHREDDMSGGHREDDMSGGHREDDMSGGHREDDMRRRREDDVRRRRDDVRRRREDDVRRCREDDVRRRREDDVRRRREDDVRRRREDDVRRRREEEMRRRREEEMRRRREEEMRRHREDEMRRHREDEMRRHREDEMRRHREDEMRRHREDEMRRHREDEMRRHREDEMRRHREDEMRRHRDKLFSWTPEWKISERWKQSRRRTRVHPYYPHP